MLHEEEECSSKMDEPMIQISVVSIEHTMENPHPHLDYTVSKFFNGRQVQRVPVIHIYGSTSAGQKCCLHVHKCLPYFLVPFPQQHLDEREEFKQAYLLHLAKEIERIMEFRKKFQGNKKSLQYVHDILLVRGIPFYGYWRKEELFMKIYIYNPSNVTKIASILQSGFIMKCRFQPYEVHIPYLLQFMIDYNISGMNMVSLKKVFFRVPLPQTFHPNKSLDGHVDINSQSEMDDKIFLKGNVPFGLCLFAKLDRMSYCDLEVDALAEHILNINRINATEIRSDNLEINLVQTLSVIWEEEKCRKKRLNLPSLKSNTSQSQSRLSPIITEIQEAMLSRINQLVSEENIISDTTSEQQSLLQYPPCSTLYHFIETQNTPSRQLEECVDGKSLYTEDKLNDDNEIIDILDWMKNKKIENEYCEPNSDDWETDENDEFVDNKSIEQLEYMRSQQENQDILESYFEETQTQQKEEEELTKKSQEFLSNVELIPQLDGHIETENDGKRKRDESHDSQKKLRTMPDPTSTNKITVPQYDSPILCASPVRSDNNLDTQSDYNLDMNELKLALSSYEYSSENSSYGTYMDEYALSPSANNNEYIRLEYIPTPPSAKDIKNKISYKEPYYSKHNDYIFCTKMSQLRFKGLAAFNDNYNFPLSTSSSSLPFYQSKYVNQERRKHSTKNLGDVLILEYAPLPPIIVKEAKQIQLISKSANIEHNNNISNEEEFAIDIQSDTLERPASPQWDEAMGYNRINVFGSHTNSINLNFSQVPASLKIISQEVQSHQEDIQKLAKNSALNINEESPIRRKRSQMKSQLSITSAATKESLLLDTENEFKQTEKETEYQHYLSAISIECHVSTRADLRPNPLYDPIEAILISVQNNIQKDEYMDGVLVVGHENRNLRNAFSKEVYIKQYPSENALLIAFIDLIQKQDPDIILGFEIQTQSLGYLIERSAIVLGNNICKKISRAIDKDSQNEHLSFHDEWGRMKQSGIHIRGRIVLNLWRLLRYEVKLNIYTFENIVFNVLGIRFPHFSYRKRTEWYNMLDKPDGYRHSFTVLHYYQQKARLNLRILFYLDFINRIVQLAKVFGIGFFNVISRGSQYRVESMMLRLAKPRNYVILSPSKEQVRQQNAIECIPLVMEPLSKMYSNPVIVLDFQSLYPSIVIAYNLCFSTCLGKIGNGSGVKRLGVINDYTIPEGMLRQLKKDLIVTPNGIVFVNETIRPGVLPRMLREILDTRIMIKKAMKDLKTQNLSNQEKEIMYRNLNARQFGLKLIANVTYGYTSANYSGRMPMSDLADSIVQIGRSTLEEAIQIVNKDFAKYGASVVYGDSVTGDTPILCRYISSGLLTFRRIDELSDNRWEKYHQDKEATNTFEPLEVWTEKGFTRINRVIRHKSHKEMYRIIAQCGSVSVTADHSLLNEKAEKVKPCDLKIGHKLLHSDLPIAFNIKNCEFSEEEAFIMGLFFSAGSCSVTNREYSWRILHRDHSLLLAMKGFLEAIYDIEVMILDAVSPLFLYEIVATEGIEAITTRYLDLFYDKEYKKRIPDQILNAVNRVKLKFWEGYCAGYDRNYSHHKIYYEIKGQIGASGLYFLMSSLGKKVSVSTREDISDVYILKEYKEDIKNIACIKEITNLGSLDLYVYDLETENHHFSAGVGSLVVHNTDSIFVEVAGATREEAFRIGGMIAEAVTLKNPSPMKLQMEKVFHPCILVTKKRYVGYAYENATQKEPVFDAKGIEVVRRDSCKAVASMMEKCLRIIFETKDISKVKTYCERQWSKILKGKINIKDFIFAKEVRLGTYSEKGTLPPAAIVAQEEMERDPRAEPMYAERISYLVVYGNPNARLVDMVVSPHRFLENKGSTMRLHCTYYITKQIIPALDRIFSLMGVDIKSWYDNMAKNSRSGWKQLCTNQHGENNKNYTIDSFYGTRYCLVCETGFVDYRNRSNNNAEKEDLDISNYVCLNCRNDPQQTSTWLYSRYRDVGVQLKILRQLCMTCMFGCYDHLELVDSCDSLDCSIMFSRKRTTNHHNSIEYLIDKFHQIQLPINNKEEWF